MRVRKLIAIFARISAGIETIGVSFTTNFLPHGTYTAAKFLAPGK